MRGLANHAGLTLHLRLLVPGNAHHAIEAQLQGRRPRARRSPWPPNPRVARGAVDQGEPVSPEVGGARLRDEQPAQRDQGAGAARRRGARHPRPRGRGGRRRRRAARASATSARPCGGSATQGLDEAVAGPSTRGVPVLGHLPRAAAAVRRERGEPGRSRARRAARGRCGACAPTASCRTSAGAGSDWAPGTASARRPGSAGEPTYYFVHTYGCEPRGPLAGARPGRARRAVLRRRGPPGRGGRPVPPREVERRGARPAGPLARRGPRRAPARA